MEKKRRTIVDERKNKNDVIKTRTTRTEINRRNYLKLKDRIKKEAGDTDKTSEKKDRGDIKKEEKRKSKIDEEIQVDVKYAGDGGDTQVKKLTEEKPENPRLYQIKQVSEKSLQRIYDNMNKKFKPLNIYMKRQLAEKYTFRKTEAKSEVKNEEDAKNKMEGKVEKPEEPSKKLAEEIPIVQLKNKISAERFVIHEDIRPNKKPEKKPVIKTISSKNDPTKMYKAVTFVEHRKGRTLQLSVPKPWQRSPTPVRKTPVKSKLTMTQTSKTSLKTKSTKSDRKHRSKRKRVLSPQLFLNKHPSPTTEVARWAPSSVTGHTKPYYEAWVNTTLAAISRGERQNLIDNESLIRSFQQVLDDVSTEVVQQDCSLDERKTGKIKVNTKNKGRWERVVANLIANKKV